MTWYERGRTPRPLFQAWALHDAPFQASAATPAHGNDITSSGHHDESDSIAARTLSGRKSEFANVDTGDGETFFSPVEHFYGSSSTDRASYAFPAMMRTSKNALMQLGGVAPDGLVGELDLPDTDTEQ